MITKNDVVYISGPMTGIKDYNYPAFLKAEFKLLKKYKCTVENPARNFDGDKNRPRYEYMRRDIERLLRSSAVLFLPDWEDSRGARLEFAIAKELELPMYDHKARSFLAEKYNLKLVKD